MKYTFHSCYSSDGANIPGSELAPDFISDIIPVTPVSVHKYIEYGPDKTQNIQKIVHKSSSGMLNDLENGLFPILIGGDHSLAMASIYAAYQYCQKTNKKLFVFWFDAHTDINTYKESITKNIHGMPLSILTGIDTSGIILAPNTYLDIERITYFGARSIDPFEASLINTYQMPIFSKANQFEQFIQKLKSIEDDAYFHISFDVDCLDPLVAQGVSTPEAHGLSLEVAKQYLTFLFKDPRVHSFDLVEYNPLTDDQNKTTLNNIKQLIGQLAFNK